MKIFQINPIKFHITQPKQRENYENTHTEYSQYRVPVLTPQLKADTVSFTAKIPSLVTPTMEDLINRTKAVDILRFNILRLAKNSVTCPCCGHLMLDVDTFNAFETLVLQTENPDELLKLVGSMKKYFHPVEAKVYSIMQSMHSYYPNMTLHEMLQHRLKISERKLIEEQSKTLIKVGIKSRNLPEEEHKKVQELIGETYERLLDNRGTSRFSRRVFLAKLNEILKNVDDENLRNKLIQLAAKLPAAYNNLDAFIVKYAKRNYKNANPDQKIALRMLSNSLVTIEHIVPTKLGGDTTPSNLAIECAACNNRRNHQTVVEQVIENPEMRTNYKKYVNKLIDLHLAGILEKAYITQTNRTYSRASNGLLCADLSRLRPQKKYVKVYSANENIKKADNNKKQHKKPKKNNKSDRFGSSFHSSKK